MSLSTALLSSLALLAAALAGVLGYSRILTVRLRNRAESLVPPPGRFLTLDGGRIHYVERGAGPPILFLHGLGGTQFHFSHPLFDALAADFRLVAVDRPGSGYSTRAADAAAGPLAQAGFVARFIEAAGLERPLLVGHSLGGAIALATALEHPRAVSGLALLAPLTRKVSDIPPAFRPLYIRRRWLRRLIAETIAVPAAARTAETTLDFVFGPQSPPEDYAVAGGALSGLRPSHFYASASDYVAVGADMASIEARYGEIALPVGILFGTADRVLDHRRHGLGMREAVPGLELELLEGVGHMPQYAETDRVAAFIRRMAARAFPETHAARRAD